MRTIRKSLEGPRKRSRPQAFGSLGGPRAGARFKSTFSTRPRPINGIGLRLERLEPRHLLSANPIITEFMAENDDNVALGDSERDFGKPDPLGDGSTPDWIEIYNAGDEALDLQGYHLTDDPDDLAQWTFPSVVLEPDAYLLVFATGSDGEDGVGELGYLHATFALRARGEYLALVAPDETTIVSEFLSRGRDFPPQVSNVSYGLAPTAHFVTPRSEATYWVPLNNDLGNDWTLPEFNALANGFSPGKASLGYESRPTDRTNFLGRFETEIPEGTHAAFVRMEFDVQDASSVSKLLLKLQYDNGFIAYINGVEVARNNAPDNTDWSSTASSVSPRDSVAMNFEDFDLAEHTGAIQDGKNVLGIHWLNHLSDATDMLLGVALVGDLPLAEANRGYLASPTPGAANVFVDSFTGPLIRDVTENPGALADGRWPGLGRHRRSPRP